MACGEPILCEADNNSPLLRVSVDPEKLAKMALDTCTVLADLTARCMELDACLKDATANAYDGATTRAMWRKSLAKADEFLKTGKRNVD